MYLKTIKMIANKDPEYTPGDTKYRVTFNYHVFFIGYYLSQRIKKERFETDGSFDAIYIFAGTENYDDIVGSQAFWDYISIPIKFDFAYYDNASERERCHYCIEIYKAALARAARVKPIPYDKLVFWLDELEAKNYIDTWKFRNMLIREYGLRIHFTACLTTNDFTIRADVYRKLNEPPICGGIVVRTKPDSIHFDHITKRMAVEDNRVYIQASLGAKFFYLNLSELASGHFELHLCKSHFTRKDSIETFQYLQRCLMYDGNDFNL